MHLYPPSRSGLPVGEKTAAGRATGVERLPFERTPARILVNPSLLPNAVIKRTGMREVPNGGEPPAHRFLSPVGYQVKVVPSFGGIGGRVTGAKLRVEFAPGRPSI